MAGRLAIGIAVAASFVTTGGLYAQATVPMGGPAAAAPNANFGPATYGSPSSMPSYAPTSSPGYGPGSTGNYAGGNGDSAPGGYPPQAGPCGYMPAAAYPPGSFGSAPSQSNVYVDCNGMTSRTDIREPQEVDETPLEEALCRAARNVIFNIDYINWGIVKPQTELIGAQPSLATLNPVLAELPQFIIPFVIGNTLQKSATEPFPVDGGVARAYDTGPISLAENSGIKGTLSLPMTYGSVEFTGFILQHAESQVNLGGLPQGTAADGDQFFAAIPVKLNEQTSDLVALYSQFFAAEFTSLVFGGECNVVFNPIVPKDLGLLIRPMIGFRYLGIQEAFDVVAANPGVATSTIDSRTMNNIFGPQVGLRFELVTQWFVIGAEPRLTIGVNEFVSSVGSFDPTTGSAGDRIAATRFTPVGAFDLYTKIPLHDKVKLYFAYNLLGTGNISRPQQQIDYNVNEVNGALVNDIHLSLAHSEFIVQGFSAGLEFNF